MTIDYRYELEKIRSRAYVALARRIPEPIVQMSLYKAGWTRIRSGEEVPAVPFTELLRRSPH